MAEVGASNYQSIWINIIQPDQEHRAESLVKWTRLWRKFQNVFEAFARLLFLAGAVLSYASGVYENKVLAFVAGTVITTAIAINQFSIYAGKESAERKTELIQHVRIKCAALRYDERKTVAIELFSMFYRTWYLPIYLDVVQMFLLDE